MELWTTEHIRTLLPATFVMVAIAIVLRLLIGSKEHKIRMIPLQICSCILVALEIGKQVVSASRGYDLYHLPFHFCSIFIFALPAMSFYKGKHKQTVARITTAVSAAMFLLMLIYPNLIYSAGNVQAYFDDYMSFHTVSFHNLVMLCFLLIVCLDLYEPEKTGAGKAAGWFTVGFCTVAATMAQLLQTNYANFYSCNIPVLEAVKESIVPVLGAAITQLLYVLIVAVLHILFVQLSYWLCRMTYRFTRIQIKEKV